MLTFQLDELQLMFDVSSSFANKRRYEYNGEKSNVLIITPTSKAITDDLPEWTLAGSKDAVTDTIVQVGVPRYA